MKNLVEYSGIFKISNIEFSNLINLIDGHGFEAAHLVWYSGILTPP